MRRLAAPCSRRAEYCDSSIFSGAIVGFRAPSKTLTVQEFTALVMRHAGRPQLGTRRPKMRDCDLEFGGAICLKDRGAPHRRRVAVGGYAARAISGVALG